MIWTLKKLYGTYQMNLQRICVTCSAAMDKMPLPQSSTSERQQESGTELDSAENVVFSQSKYS